MNDYDFGKYYRNKSRTSEKKKSSSGDLSPIYKKLSIAAALVLVVFFAGFMTGINFQENRISKRSLPTSVGQIDKESGVVESADIAPEQLKENRKKTSENQSEKPDTESVAGPGETEIKSTLSDPENAYIILAKRYNEESKDRALYYAGILKKMVKDYNYEVIPSIRGKSIKIYVGPMKGRQNAEKMLVRIKSIPEFSNSAILYKK